MFFLLLLPLFFHFALSLTLLFLHTLYRCATLQLLRGGGHSLFEAEVKKKRRLHSKPSVWKTLSISPHHDDWICSPDFGGPGGLLHSAHRYIIYNDSFTVCLTAQCKACLFFCRHSICQSFGKQLH